VIKAGREEIVVTETEFEAGRRGPPPHVHKLHADSFYVLEGGLAVLVHDEEKMLEPGAFVCAPPEVVHGFRSTSRARFLNFHTPDGGFADNLRARDRGEPGGFDSVDAEPGSGPPGFDAVFLAPGEGERLEADHRVGTIKVGREELSMIEFDLEPGFAGPDPHDHDDHVDSFYVLEGEAEFLMDDETLRLGAGSFVVAPLGVVHTFSNPRPRPGTAAERPRAEHGFHDRLRAESD
jgi:quercetin dioxygenase-like cupin family protein